MEEADCAQVLACGSNGEQQQVREVMDSLGPTFVGLLTVDGVLTYANKAALEAIGAKLEEVLGKHFEATPWWSFFEDARKQLHEAIKSAAHGVGTRFEFPFQDARGQVVTMDFSLIPAFGAHGEVAYLILWARDITQPKRAEHALFVTQFAVDHAYSAILKLGADARVVYANLAASLLLGYQRSDLLDMHIGDIAPGLSEGKWAAKCTELKGRDQVHFESVYRHADGREIPVDIQACHVEHDSIQYCFFYALDITALKAAERQIYHMTHFDELTGLPNRALLAEQLQEILSSTDVKQQSVTVMVIGLDRLKLVKEALNHARADQVLRRCARKILNASHGVDLVARISDDEFAMTVKADATHPGLSAEVAQRLLNAMATPVSVEKQEIFINSSIGLAAYPQDGETAEDLLKAASTALGRSKRHGGNAIHVYSSLSESRNPGRLPMETALRRALKYDELAIFYQPQLELNTCKLAGVEALLRWHHPEQGLISTAKFIPIAEETGLILPIGEWVLHQACMQLRDWARQGVQVGHLSVNLSARQFRQKGLAGLLSRVLRDTGIEPDALDLELTESMLMDDIESAVRTMKILKEMGMHLSLDDFGTGYSSLSHLKRFPIDTLKIDQSFVSEIPDDPRSAAVVDGIIALGHRLTLSVLAEGVETREQLNLLRQSGCDVVQGYLFCHPVPAEQLTTLLRDSRPQFPPCSDHSAPAAR